MPHKPFEFSVSLQLLIPKTIISHYFFVDDKLKVSSPQMQQSTSHIISPFIHQYIYGLNLYFSPNNLTNSIIIFFHVVCSIQFKYLLTRKSNQNLIQSTSVWLDYHILFTFSISFHSILISIRERNLIFNMVKQNATDYFFSFERRKIIITIKYIHK